MTAVLATRSSPVSIFSGWPSVAARLEGRGIEPNPLEAETREAFENRVATGLMALFRDTRDALCFEALYAFSGPSVLSWIQGLMGRELGHLDPGELLQDTFVNVYRYPGSFREDHVGSFRVWVRTIAGNVLRRAAILRAKLAQHELDADLHLEDRGRDPMQRMVDDEQERRLRKAWLLLLWHYAEAWKELSQRDRRTLHLVEVEGLSYQEAGRILSVGRSNMKMIVFRSRKRIARRMRAAMSGALPRRATELVA